MEKFIELAKHSRKQYLKAPESLRKRLRKSYISAMIINKIV